MDRPPTHGCVQNLLSLGLHSAFFEYTILHELTRSRLFQACWGPAWSVIANAVAAHNSCWNGSAAGAMAARAVSCSSLSCSCPDTRPPDHFETMASAGGNRVPLPTADHTSNRVSCRAPVLPCLEARSATAQFVSRLK